MIYQYDQALPLPTKDLYDTQVMQMAVAAAKDMYDRGEKRIQDFYDKYGDFYSPIASDVDYVYNEGEGKIKNAIADLYAKGIDPVRSAEGRATIQQVIRSVNTAEIAKRKLRAKNAEEYYKNMGILKQKGLYNEDFSKFLKEDPNSWSDDFMGITSPTAYDDLNAHTTHWFDKVNRDGYLRTDEEGYDWYGVKPEDLESVMSTQMPDFINSDYGKFQMELARQQVGPDATQEEVINQLKKNIVSANSEVSLRPERRLNPLKQMEIQDKYKAVDAARDHRYRMDEIAFKHKLDHPELYDENGNRLPGPSPQNGPTPWNIQKESQMVDNVNSKIGVVIRGNTFSVYDPSKFTGAAQNIITSLNSQLEQLKEKYGKKVQDGYEEKEVEKTKYMPSVSLSGAGRYVTYKVKEQVPKYKYELDKRYYTKSKPLQDKINQYKKLLSGDFSNFDFAQFRDDFKNIVNSTKGAKTNEELMKRADSFWSMFEVDAADSTDKERQRNAFAGTEPTTEIAALPGKYRQVSFERMNMNYTPMRRVNIAGTMRFGRNAFQKVFNEWLSQSGVVGYMIDDNIAHAVIPTPKGVQHDFAGMVSITAADFDQFYDKIPKEDKKGWSKNEVARLLGLVPRSRDGKRYDTNSGSYPSIAYYDVPTTYTMEDPYEIGQINKKYSKDMFGSDKAFSLSVNDESAGFK